MIDWLWMRLACRESHLVKTPRIAAINADGEVEWESPRWLQARGSHDATMAVRPIAAGIEISGSPAKFLQGHNVFGSDDVHGLAFGTVAKVLEAYPLPFSDDELAQVVAGDIELAQVDINYSYSTGSLGNALAWCRAAEQHGHLEHRGRGMMKGATVVFGQRSRHWKLKAYAKGQELRDHKLPAELPHRDELLAWAEDKVRPEVTLRARYLRDLDLDRVNKWCTDTPRRVFLEHLAKLHLSGDLSMTDEATKALPPSLQGALAMWNAGTDLRDALPPRTFYRYRRKLLDLAGVDIAVAPVNERSNVVPLVRVIEAVPAELPAWAVGTPLLWQAPERRRA